LREGRRSQPAEARPGAQELAEPLAAVPQELKAERPVVPGKPAESDIGTPAGLRLQVEPDTQQVAGKQEP